MRFSAWPGTEAPWSELLSLARHLEATGWDGIWLRDHFMPHQGDTTVPFNEAWSTLAAIAATVPRVRLGVLVTGNTYRHPVVLAKMAATIDVISGGRLVLGIGGAWQESEHVAYGIPFYTVGERLRRMEEACQIITSLFENEKTTFEGRYYQLKDAPLSPKPLQRPRPPLLVGGRGEKVTLRIAAQYADEWNVGGTPEVYAHKSSVLEKHCADVGRDPSEIKRSVGAFYLVTDDPVEIDNIDRSGFGTMDLFAGTADEIKAVVKRYDELGVDELVVTSVNVGDPVAEQEHYDRFIQQVAPAFR
jgi:F420-dependent oxidoreductase-like protein